MFSFVPVVEATYWTVRILDVRAQFPNGVNVNNLCPSRDCHAIIDSGTYLVYFPFPQMQQVASASPITLTSCLDIQHLPTFYIELYAGENKPPVVLVMEPREYVLHFEADQCVAGIAPDKPDAADALWTLGQTFIRMYTPLFDRRGFVGFALSLIHI